MLTLAVEKRVPTGQAGEKTGVSAHSLRRAGSIPAVVYGAHQASTPVVISARAFEKVLRAAGEATIVSLTGLGEELPVLIHEVSLDPITNQPEHVDFYAVTKGQKVEVSIPLVFVGESSVVKSGANLIKVLHEIEIKADPMNLPHDISVDISKLVTTDDRIYAKDLALPAGAELVTDGDDVVALAQEVVEEKESTTPADISTIEVEKKGKTEEVSEESAA